MRRAPDGHGLGDYVLDVYEGLRGADDDGLLRYWSMHPGGAHFTFCDGSVRLLSYSIDQKVFLGLGSRNGREVVSGF